MKFLILLSMLLGSFIQAAEVQTATFIDVQKYMGSWYEIARYDNSFQKQCGATKVQYTLQKNKVDVVNRCVNKKGKIETAHAKAFVVDTKTNAKLTVSFVPLLNELGWFGGAYWIMDVGADYQYAIVGHPTRQYLWILSRTPELDDNTYNYLLNIIRNNGYDLNKLHKTPTWVD